VDAHDVLVRDLPRQEQLALEAADLIAARVFVAALARKNRLDRYGHAKLVVIRLVDGAHASAAEQLEHGVARPELGAWRQ
jgi:hypothetical protein